MANRNIENENWRQALAKFAAELRSIYGDRLSQVILYGSRAREEAEEASDIDTLIILNSLDDFWGEFAKISQIANRISLEFNVVISAFPTDTEDYNKDEIPLLINSRREGVRVG